MLVKDAYDRYGLTIIGSKYDLEFIHNLFCKAIDNGVDFLGCAPGCRLEEEDLPCTCKECMEESITWFCTDNAGIRRDKNTGKYIESEGDIYTWSQL